MEHQDEAYESIPWERLGSLDRPPEYRRWGTIILVAVVVGVAAFALRRVPAPAVPVVAQAEAPASSTTSTVGLPTLLPETDLLATGYSAAPIAERFTIELLAAGGADVVGARAVEAGNGAADGVVEVVAVVRTDPGVETIALAVEVGDGGAVTRWWPAAVDPLDVFVPTAGAEPPPEVLAGFARTAGRWGTMLDVVESGLSGDRWWAEVDVRLPSGLELPVMVWEDAG